MKKVTYKNPPRLSSLESIGADKTVYMKIKGKQFGLITKPHWNNPSQKYFIWIARYKTEEEKLQDRGSEYAVRGEWKNVRIKFTFDSLEEAKKWIEDNIDEICQEKRLHFSEK